MAAPLRMGILGAARIAPMALVAPSGRTRAATVLAVAARDPARAGRFAARHGIPRSGNAWDSFPSGHAVHLGAAAGPLRALVPRRFRRWVWPALMSLAATRLGLLAHYPSDVAAGLLIGVALETAVGRVQPGRR